MSTLSDRPTLTARAVLFGPDDDTVEEVAHALQEGQVVKAAGGALGRLSSVGRQAVNREVGRVATGLAEVDLVDVCVAGWRKHTELRAAARRTRDLPGSEELVDLATHRIESMHNPWIDLFVDGARVGTIRFELRLELVIKGLVATVCDGRLVAVQSGLCELTGRLSCEGVKLAERKSDIDLGLVLHIEGGFALLPDDPRHP